MGRPNVAGNQCAHTKPGVTAIAWRLVSQQDRNHIEKVTALAMSAVHVDLSADMEALIQDETNLSKIWQFEDPSITNGTCWQPSILNVIMVVRRWHGLRQTTSSAGSPAPRVKRRQTFQ